MKSFIAIFSLLIAINVIAQSGKTFLIVLAHPDDETAIGQMIANLTPDNKIILVIATDGRYGVRPHAGTTAGDSLAAIRAGELKCSCQKLGVDSLIQLNYHDGFGQRTSTGEYFTQVRKIREDVTRIIEAVSPDYLVSFGPDGDTGHSDHRNIGNVVTEVILREGWYTRFPLYYLAWTKALSDHFGGINYMQDEYINVSFAYTEKDEKKNQDAIRCHASQFNVKEIEEGIAKDAAETRNRLYFRRFTVSNGVRNGF